MEKERSETARVLLENHECKVVSEGTLHLQTSYSGEQLDLMIRRISQFALGVSTIIASIVVLRLCPWQVILIDVLWLGIAAGFLTFALLRRREQGVCSFDFDASEIEIVDRFRRKRSYRIDQVKSVAVDKAWDELLPYTLQLNLPKNRVFRLARGKLRDFDGLLRVFRTYQIKVEKLPEEEEE